MNIFSAMDRWIRSIELETGSRPPAIVLPQAAAAKLEEMLNNLLVQGSVQPQVIGGGLTYWGLWQGIALYTMQ